MDKVTIDLLIESVLNRINNPNLSITGVYISNIGNNYFIIRYNYNGGIFETKQHDNYNIEFACINLFNKVKKYLKNFEVLDFIKSKLFVPLRKVDNEYILPNNINISFDDYICIGYSNYYHDLDAIDLYLSVACRDFYKPIGYNVKSVKT